MSRARGCDALDERLRPGRPLGWRIGAWVAALLCFGWIVSVALSKNPLGALRGLAA